MVRIKGEQRYGKRKNGYSLQDVGASVKAYVEASRRASLSRGVLDSEAEKLYHCFRDYVKSMNCEQVQKSFSDFLAEFYSEVLGLDDKESRGIRSSLTRRFKKMIKKYNAGDSGNQRKLDEFLVSFSCTPVQSQSLKEE